MKKTLLCILLAAVLLCTAFAVPISAAQEGAAQTAANTDLSATGGDDYPSIYRDPAKDTVIDRWKFFNRQCTSFVAWCMESRNGISDFNNYHFTVNGVYYAVRNSYHKVENNAYGTRLGDAKYWGTAFQTLGFPVNNTPAVGAIAWRESGKYGHVAWVSAVNGTSVTVEEYNYSIRGCYQTPLRVMTTSQWIAEGYRFIHVKDIPMDGHVMAESEAAGQTIPDGDYWACSAIGRNYFLDIPGNEPAAVDGTNVQMWGWPENTVPSVFDAFRFEYRGNGFYKITQKDTHYCLDVVDGSLTAGANIRLWPSNDSVAQQWSVEVSDTGYRLRARCSSFYMDVYNGGYANGTNVRTWLGNGAKAQGFALIPCKLDERPLPDGEYAIWSSLKDSLFLDVIGVPSEFKTGSNIDVWNTDDPTNRKNAEHYMLEYAGDGWYRIYEKTSGLAVEIANDPITFADKNQNAMLYEKNDSRGQFWKIRKNSDGTCFLINKLAGQYLDVWNANTDNGTNVQAHPFNGSAAQRWSFVPIGSNVSVSVTSFLSMTDDVTLTLTHKGETAPAYSTTMRCDTDSAVLIGYFGEGTFTGVADGAYILRAEKKNHVARETELTVDGASLGMIKLHPIGDVNGDGIVNTVDMMRANIHARGVTELTGYEFNCANVNGDDIVNTTDVMRINLHAKSISSLWK